MKEGGWLGKKLLLILSLFAMVATLLFITLSNFSQSDKCLDSGGRWNNATKSCEK